MIGTSWMHEQGMRDALVAEGFGIDAAVLDKLWTDIGTAPVDARMNPLLAYGLDRLPQAARSQHWKLSGGLCAHGIRIWPGLL